MSDDRRKPSYWETVPGIITAVATLIGAVAALITALYSAKVIGHDEPGKAAVKPVQAAAVRRPEVGKVIEPASPVSPQIATQPVPSIKTDRSAPAQGDLMTDPITGMELVYIPEGCFQMGSNEYNNEKPVHKVCVDGFWMGKYEVPQGQWQKIMGKNLAKFQKGDNYPVVWVSWEDAQKFISTLNKKSGEKYRLPTEAEWEYAARAGASYKYSGGDDLDAVAWYDNSSRNTPHPVGQKKANAFGLYDMSGNAWEWCADWYGEKYYASSPKNNPTGPNSGMHRVLRGGGWFASTVHCRSVDRRHYAPESESRPGPFGFRLVLPFQVAGR